MTEAVLDSGRKAVWMAFAACAVAIAASGCSPAPVSERGPAACAALDSLFAASGFGRPIAISGNATVDANQYRVRGKIRVDARAPGEAVVEFTSTVLFGHAREDLVFSSVGDTLRIVDRERGAFYEGADAESFVARSLDTDLDVRLVLRLALGGRPACDELTGVVFRPSSDGSLVCAGKRAGRDFRVAFGADRRLLGAEWPVQSGRGGWDRFRVSYEWGPEGEGDDALQGVVLALERREWRCKIRSGG